jgi:hypothetical protein
MYILAFSGTQTSSDPFDQQNQATATIATLATGSVTPTTSGQLLVSAQHHVIGDLGTIDSGFTRIHVDSFVGGVTYGGASAWKEHTSGAINPSWTLSTSTLQAAKIATFKAGTGAQTVTGTTLSTTSMNYPVSVTGGVEFVRHVMATWRRNRQ